MIERAPHPDPARWKMLNLSWIAFFLTFVVWFNLAPFKSTVARIFHLSEAQVTPAARDRCHSPGGPMRGHHRLPYRRGHDEYPVPTGRFSTPAASQRHLPAGDALACINA